ncbi:MAG: aldose 1-epimerase family protein, partial [Lachnospiraceae bacterium]
MSREWIQNDCLKVGINTVGGVMFSLQDHAGKEYLWQGDEAIWKNQDVEIFPYIARLTEGKYTFQGKTYSMG